MQINGFIFKHHQGHEFSHRFPEPHTGGAAEVFRALASAARHLSDLIDKGWERYDLVDVSTIFRRDGAEVVETLAPYTFGALLDMASIDKN